MLEHAVDHVGDGFEAAVGVLRGALGLAGRVVDLAHLVHVHERVEGCQVDPANARRTGKPSPSRPEGAVVTEITRRSALRALAAPRAEGRSCHWLPRASPTSRASFRTSSSSWGPYSRLCQSWLRVQPSSSGTGPGPACSERGPAGPRFPAPGGQRSSAEELALAWYRLGAGDGDSFLPVGLGRKTGGRAGQQRPARTRRGVGGEPVAQVREAGRSGRGQTRQDGSLPVRRRP